MGHVLQRPSGGWPRPPRRDRLNATDSDAAPSRDLAARAAEGAIALHPQIHFTEDGTKPWEGERANSYLIKARATKYNDVYLNNLLF